MSDQFKRHLPVLLITIFVVAAGLRVNNLYTDYEVIAMPDSGDYLRKASWPILSWGLGFRSLEGVATWLEYGRSPTVPLLSKISGNTPDSIVIFQLLLSLTCWGLLALFVSRAIESHLLRLGAFLIFLLFSMSDYVIIWDRFLLSDSIAVSLFALFVSCWLWLLEEWHWGKVALVVLVGCLWTFTRDTNAWAIAMLAGFLIVVAVLWRSPRYLLIGAVFAMCFFVNEASQNSSQRWVMPFVNVLGKRILPDPDRTDYFAMQGMPVTPSVMQQSGQSAWSRDNFYYNSPDLEELREWVNTRGKSSYTRFLLTHPVYMFVEPLKIPGYLVDPKLKLFYTRSPGFSPILPGLVSQVVYPRWGLPVLWVAGLMVATWFLATSPSKRTIWLAPFLLILFAYPHCAIAWHGDAIGIERHTLLAGVQLRLGLWLALIFAADSILSHLKLHKPKDR